MGRVSSLVDGAKHVLIEGEKYLAKTTAKRSLKQVDLRFEGHELRGLEQNPETPNVIARQGMKVMQFLESGRHIVLAAEAKMKTYG